MPRITINLNEKEAALKDILKKLSESEINNNPYYNRSESVISKMILQPALKREYEKYLKPEK